MDMDSATDDDEGLFRSLFAAYPDALLVVDGRGRIVQANPMAAELLGYGHGELVGLPVEQLVPDSIRSHHAAYREAYGRAPRSRPMGTQMDLVARRRDGSEVMVEIALSPLQQHGLPYVVAAIRDIGAYPRVRQALQRARYAEHLAQFGRHAVDAGDPAVLLDQAAQAALDALQIERCTVYLLEREGRVLRVASEAGTSLTRRGEEVGGWRVSELGRVVLEGRTLAFAPAAGGLPSALAVPLSDRGRTVGAVAVASSQPQRFGADEQRFLESLATLLATTLKRAETEEQLAHAQRLESVGQLTGGIAHDFNNLLTVISGNLQVLEEHPGMAGDALADETVDAASRATRRAAELTRKLLAFSRRQVLQPSRVDASALLRSLTDMLRRTLDQRIEIELDIEPDCPECWADAGQLESALLNVAINSRDAMPGGGKLSFSVASALAPPAVVAGDGLDAGRVYLAIAVRDTGVGMPDEVRERAFEPFFTTKDTGYGTGLGLSTVYGFARQSRGTVTLASAPGAGTTVTLYLPLVADSAAALGPPAAIAALPRGLRVVMAEDDAEVRRVIAHHLAWLGFEVSAHATGEDALHELADGSPCDLLLTDIALGTGLRGTEVAQRALAMRAGLPVLLMSGFAGDLPEVPAGMELLRKPFRRQELAASIARVLRRA